MIEVTKLGGERIFVNADHIECVEAQPDTALLLGNGKRIVVLDKVADVVRKVIEYQRQIRAAGPPRTSVAEGVENNGAVVQAAKSAGPAKRTD